MGSRNRKIQKMGFHNQAPKGLRRVGLCP